MNTIKDGVGERLITINDAFLNTPGFKAAGWRSNPAHIKRTHSPPIPTAITSEYFQAPPGSVKLNAAGGDDVEEGGMVTGGGAGDTMGPGIITKRRRRREQMEEEDSSDLSDDSEEDDQRAAQAIKFAKMPVRIRSGSSPIRNSAATSSTNITSPEKKSGAQARRGSQSAVDAVKERARRDTVTSSEMSSENDFDASAYKRQQMMSKAANKASRALAKQTSDPNVGVAVKRQESDLLEEEMEDDSDASDMSSAFAESVDSASMLDSVDGPLAPSPETHIVGTMPRGLTRQPSKRPAPVPEPLLQALPPPRPISTIQPKSLLSAAINARKAKAVMPFEKFASLSGQGDPNPLRLRIWAPFATSDDKSYEVLIRRTVHGGESGGDRQVKVADLIGLSLWRYFQENLEPAIADEKLNVNCWTLRLIEDDEVDYDFPALDRTKPVVQFSTVNNRAARSRSGSKPYDEFGLVEATDAQFRDNQNATPQFQQESRASAAAEDELAPKPAPVLQPSPMPARYGNGNPLLTTMSALRSNGTLADMPAAPIMQTVARSGVQKLLRVHIHSSDAAPGQMVTVDVTTDTYMAEVLDIVCKKRQLDKANHVLKLTGSGTVVLLDRTVGSIGNRTDLDLFRRRFATDGPLTMSGSPGSASPRAATLADSPVYRKIKKSPAGASHPLAREAVKQDEIGSANYRKYTVWRKQPMRFVGMNERTIAIDGEYLHIMPVSTSKNMFEGQGKTTTVHFSNVVGCKVTRRHPSTFKVRTEL